MTNVSLKIIEQSEQVGMFSICFDNNEESEFEKFLNEFKDNATYISHHRGITHSIPFTILWPILITFLIFAIITTSKIILISNI